MGAGRQSNVVYVLAAGKLLKITSLDSQTAGIFRPVDEMQALLHHGVLARFQPLWWGCPGMRHATAGFSLSGP